MLVNQHLQSTETSIHLIVDDASELFITNLRRSQFQNHDGFGNATTAWCSPEMQFGSSKISNKTDVYSAGLLIYSILTGETNSDKLKKNMQVQKLPKFSGNKMIALYFHINLSYDFY